MASIARGARGLLRSIDGSPQRLIHLSRVLHQSEAGPSTRATAVPEAGPSKLPLNDTTNTSTASTSNVKAVIPEQPKESQFGTSASAKAAEEDRHPLPYLSAPLGVRVKPSSRKLSFTEKRDLAFDYDRRIAKRKAIVKEATRGYFSDFHAMRSHGGKTWRAPTTLIKQERSLFFPSIKGTSLDSGLERNTADFLPGKVSVVCIMTSVLSEQHAKSFYEAALDIYKKDSNFQFVQINLQENRLKAYVVSLFTSGLREKIPLELQRNYILSHQDLSMEREDMGLHNKHVGYTYLVGPDGKIRWAAGAFAEKEERQALVACTGVLLSRLSEEQRGRK